MVYKIYSKMAAVKVFRRKIYAGCLSLNIAKEMVVPGPQRTLPDPECFVTMFALPTKMSVDLA